MSEKPIRHKPAKARADRVRLRCKFDLEDPRPILGDLLRERREGVDRRFVAAEIGIGGHVVRDLENHYGALQHEIDAVLVWLGLKPHDVQLPRAILARAYGRPARGETADSPIATAILEHVEQGNLLSKFESPEYSVSSKRAQALVARWLRQDKDFRVKFEQALSIGAYFLAEKALEASHNLNVNPAVAKNQILAYQWMAEKFNRRQFGREPTNDININVGLGDALEALERRRRSKELPAPQNLTVIDVEAAPVKEHTIINGVVQLD